LARWLGALQRAWPLPRLGRPLPGSAGSLAADPLTADIPTPTTMRSPRPRRQLVIAIDTNMAVAQGNPVGIMHGSKAGNRNG
jgi:hypothetical protein